MKARRALNAALAFAAMLALCACGAAGRSTTTTSSSQAVNIVKLTPLSATPASRQLEWVIGELNRSAIPTTAVLAQHFAASFLAVEPPAKLIAALTPLAGLNFQIEGVVQSAGDTALQVELSADAGASFLASIDVEAAAPNRIAGLFFKPLASPITTWSGIDAALSRLASHASIYAGYANGSALHEFNANQAGAIGSAFKLYVLGALGSAVAHGQVSWNTELAIRTAWKSLPSGTLQDEPAGTKFTLLHYARQMISVSDNTAADHLIHELGRGAVEAQLSELGNQHADLDEPFLTTRELFALKLAAPAALRAEYAVAGAAERTRLLAQVDKLTATLAQAKGWTAPREIGAIEWFASPADLARAIAALVNESERPGLAPLRQVLAINPGIAFDKSTWTYAAFKGGSEPGVISTTWYLRRADGKTFVLSIVLNDPKQDISTLGEVSVAEAAVNLLAKA